jgi:hypothetical protein
MLDCERWTLTHSSGGAVVLLLLLLLLLLLPPPLPLVAGLGSELELAAT